MFTHHSHHSPAAAASAVPKTPHRPHDSHSFVSAAFGCQMDPKPLGAGGFGQVFAATVLSGGEWRGSHTARHRGERIAIKITDAAMDQTGDRPRERSQDEMTGVMTDCAQEMAVQAHFSQHPTVVAVFDTAIDKVYIAMQLAVGGDLYQVFSDSVVNRRPVDEHRIAIWIGDILSALEYMIQDDYIHRDVKLENFLLDENGHALLSDFGYACKVGQYDPSRFAGTWESTAPEIMGRHGGVYSEKSDVFALGVAAYELLAGRPSPFKRVWKEREAPFDQQWAPNEAMRSALVEGLPRHVTRNAQNFVYSMLAPDMADRPTFLQLLSHPFIGRLPPKSSGSKPTQPAASISSHKSRPSPPPSYESTKDDRSRKHVREVEPVPEDEPEEPAEGVIDDFSELNVGRDPPAYERSGHTSRSAKKQESTHRRQHSETLSLGLAVSPARSARLIARTLKSPALTPSHMVRVC